MLQVREGLRETGRSVAVAWIMLLSLIAAACGAPAPYRDEPEAPTPTAAAVAIQAPAPTNSPLPQPSAAPGATRVADGKRDALDLIAYSDAEGRVFLTGRGGESPSRVDPGGGFFSWPVWSPSGDQIVFSGAPLEAGEPLRLYSFAPGGPPPRVIFTNEDGSGPILPTMPHYPLWSPDGSRLALVASTEQQLTLYLLDIGNGGGAEKVLEQAPLYASWSGDARYLIVHGGEEHFLVDSEAREKVTALEERDAQYRVPAWWPLGDRYALVAPDGNGRRALFVADAFSERRTSLGAVDAGVAFLWSPDGGALAVARSRISVGGIYDTLEFFRPDGTSAGQVISDTLIAFYWSPDSSKLAYVTLADRAGVFRWQVLDVADGSVRFVAEFTPTGPQTSLFQFFDQFAYSHQPWSPDSDALVFAGTLTGGAASAARGLRQTSQIIVANLEPITTVRPIADGLLGVWSPR